MLTQFIFAFITASFYWKNRHRDRYSDHHVLAIACALFGFALGGALASAIPRDLKPIPCSEVTLPVQVRQTHGRDVGTITCWRDEAGGHPKDIASLFKSLFVLRTTDKMVVVVPIDSSQK